MLDKNFFNDIKTLEPHCPKCGSKVDYGLSTNFDESKNCHICNSCGYELK